MNILALADGLLEVAIFGIAMIVAFIHWVLKAIGLLAKKGDALPADRRQLVEQMEERERRRASQQQQAPARGPQPATRGMPSLDQQTADWRALREALGLPADAPLPAPVRTPPPFHQPPAVAPTRPPHRHYEDSADPECDDDVIETAQAARRGMAAYNVPDAFDQENAGAAGKAAAGYRQELSPPLTQAELDIIRKLREGVALSELGTRSVSEAAAELQADTAYDIPDAESQGGKGNRSAGAKSGSRGTLSSASIRRLFTSREGIRQAILAREVLGVPKAWQDDSTPRTSQH